MHFLITSGGTREYIDTVRFISNSSSGRMGCALTRAALRSGHKVTLIAAAMTAKSPAGVNLIRVENASEMFEAVKCNFDKCDCLIMAAAVSDYTPALCAKAKMKKQNKELVIQLNPTRDILKWSGSNKKKGQVVIGFALEDKDIKANAERKLREKKLDMIVANKPSAIDSARSTVYIKKAGGDWIELSEKSKTVTAKKIIAMAQAFKA